MTNTADNETAYDEKISPLMHQIIAICQEHKIPMMASFHLRSEEGPDGEFAGPGLLCTTSLHYPGAPQPRAMAEAVRLIFRGTVVARAVEAKP